MTKTPGRQTPDSHPHDALRDARIEQALAGLRHAAPPPGMGERLLRNLHQLQTAEPQRRRSVSRMATANISWIWRTAAVSATLALGAGLFWLSQTHHASSPTTTAASGPHLALPTTLEPQQSSIIAPQLAPPAAPPVPGLQSRPIAPTPASPKTAATRSSYNSEPSQEERAALDDLHAPSHPAPPMPLTAQEKLLLRIVHRGDPQQMADLNATHRADVASNESAAFKDFFYVPPPPPPPEPDGDDE